jgi:hypothetical protein
MPLILIILSSLNLTLALLAYATSFLKPNHTHSKELGSIALSSTKKRKLYALVLGLIACILLLVVPNSQSQITPIAASILINIVTLLLSYVTQIKLLNGVRRSHELQSIAVIKLEGATAAPIELWLKKSNQEWPPINLEIGMGPWVVVASSINKPLLEQIRTIFGKSKLLKEEDLQNSLKKILNEHGVTHPMDIEGSNCTPEIKEFFEKTLIKA